MKERLEEEKFEIFGAEDGFGKCKVLMKPSNFISNPLYRVYKDIRNEPKSLRPYVMQFIITNGFWDRKGGNYHFNHFCHRRGCINTKHFKFQKRERNLSRNSCRKKLLNGLRKKKVKKNLKTLLCFCPHGKNQCFYNIC